MRPNLLQWLGVLSLGCACVSPTPDAGAPLPPLDSGSGGRDSGVAIDAGGIDSGLEDAGTLDMDSGTVDAGMEVVDSGPPGLGPYFTADRPWDFNEMLRNTDGGWPEFRAWGEPGWKPSVPCAFLEGGPIPQYGPPQVIFPELGGSRTRATSMSANGIWILTESRDGWPNTRWRLMRGASTVAVPAEHTGWTPFLMDRSGNSAASNTQLYDAQARPVTKLSRRLPAGFGPSPRAIDEQEVVGNGTVSTYSSGVWSWDSGVGWFPQPPGFRFHYFMTTQRDGWYAGFASNVGTHATVVHRDAGFVFLQSNGPQPNGSWAFAMMRGCVLGHGESGGSSRFTVWTDSNHAYFVPLLIASDAQPSSVTETGFVVFAGSYYAQGAYIGDAIVVRGNHLFRLRPFLKQYGMVPEGLPGPTTAIADDGSLVTTVTLFDGGAYAAYIPVIDAGVP